MFTGHSKGTYRADDQGLRWIAWKLHGPACFGYSSCHYVWKFIGSKLTCQHYITLFDISDHFPAKPGLHIRLCHRTCIHAEGAETCRSYATFQHRGIYHTIPQTICPRAGAAPTLN